MLKRATLVSLLVLLGVLEIYICAALFPGFHSRAQMEPQHWSEGLLLPAIFMNCVVVAIGVVSFVSPEAVQDYAVRQNSKWFPGNPFLNWMKTANYIRFIRVIGMVVYMAGLFAAFVLLKELAEIAFI